MAASEPAGLVRRAVEEIWNRGAFELADRLFAPGYVNHGGLIPDLVRGPEAIKVGVALYRRAFPGLRIDVEDLVADGETVALRWEARGASAADGTADAAPGGRGALAGVTFVRFAGGQIAESWTYWDAGGALRRLGLVPPPPRAERRRAPRRGTGEPRPSTT
jgi:ketosteroid isomerase-like protein